MSVDRVISTDLGVLAAETRRGVPSVDAVLRKAGIGMESSTATAPVGAAPSGVVLVALSLAFSRRIGRAAVGAGLVAAGAFTAVSIREAVPQDAPDHFAIMVLCDVVLNHRGFVLVLLLAALYVLVTRIASSVFRWTVEGARTDADARAAASRLLRAVDIWCFGPGIAGLASIAMLGAFIWYLQPYHEWRVWQIVDHDDPVSWRAPELILLYVGGLVAAALATGLVIAERRSRRAARVTSALASHRTTLVAGLVLVAVLAIIRVKPSWARWTAADLPEDFTMQYELYRYACNWSLLCRHDFQMKRVPWARELYRPRQVLTGVAGSALFVLGAGFALRRRRREHAI